MTGGDPVRLASFDPLPAGTGGYVLLALLHNGDDRSAVAILKRCAQAARGGGVVLVVEAVTAKAAWVPVPMGLRDDWAGALPGVGFDPAAPSIWLVEGLLFYLPPAAETYLIETVDRLSAAGSALAFEVKLEKDLLMYRDSPLYTATKQQIGIDLLELFGLEPRPDSAGRLTDHGWSTSVSTRFDFTRLHGRGPLPEPNDALAGNRWVFASRTRW